MSTILETIVQHKKVEVEARKAESPLEELKQTKYYSSACYSMSKSLTSAEASGIISEFKRKSPSKGWIHQDAIVSEIIRDYQTAGVSGISCLTDSEFFGGSTQDFLEARAIFQGPMLRKDFMIDPYQIHESKSMGADVILLIAAILTKEQVIEYTALAHELGMEVLLELHANNELEKYHESVDIVGINNRDLRDFSVSLLTSIDLKRRLPEGTLAISESGLEHPGIVCDLYYYGFRWFLMGEHFMKNNAPGTEAGIFIKELQARKQRRA